MGKIRVATTQLKGDGYNTLHEFLDYISRFLEEHAPIDILVLPEYALLPLLKSRGNVLRSKVRALYDEWFVHLEPKMISGFQKLSNSYNVHILVGSHWILKEDGPYNAAFFFAPNKEVQVFPKCNPTPPEEAMEMKKGIAPGLVTLKNGIKAGILICFDVEFPELARSLTLQGADLLLVPSLTLNERGANRVEICARSRAIENQVYVISSTNQAYLNIPVEKPIRAVGRSGIFGPVDNKTRLSDGIVIRTEQDGEEILVAELDLDTLEESRYKSEAPLRKNLRSETKI
ncbi:nitrilase-related carbon-nitrogen hydrolase [Peribacillus frigoritolerans]|uniref:nitrilase-related carbon-nitrogen hydrolase n=1 Tax=Peribacillus frigoritolerans TaxID=450367 RepID=UPI003F7F1C9A